MLVGLVEPAPETGVFGFSAQVRMPATHRITAATAAISFQFKGLAGSLMTVNFRSALESPSSGLMIDTTSRR